MKKRTLHILAFAMMTTWATTSYAAEWSYTGEHGAEHWGESFATCGEGVNQTPIDINQTTQAELTPLHLDYEGQVTELVNNGHTIQANLTGKNTLTVDGKTFELKQFHFHTPSENYLKGKQYPLEAHFVHATDKGELAVVAVMFDVGPRSNNELTTLLGSIPDDGQKVELKESLNPADLLPRDREYYRFNGSLTTPPCSEGVRWFVMQEPQTSSKAQTEKLQEVMGNNSRPLQPLNARLILE
ncbi:carbonic anhydrase [Photobacterium profundum]|uniref:Carbonic anhydrase n=1 Tax=Photobacterium profundum 3TCK TaxID=314280 RepID=Q1Z0R1_9GAMM|nr:putative carbonic anhydrase [Photobacterium profundum 3TCK]